MTHIDLNKYENFVKEVTSDSSENLDSLVENLENLNEKVNISLLLTGAIGLSSESGEFNEIVKKCAFQGKPLNDETIFHMKRELGDIIWYWINSCRSIGVDPNDVIQENIKKLESRYPGGTFDAFYSENRKENDL